MCGIAGYVLNKELDPCLLGNMLKAISYRGPDSTSYYESNAYNAGMNRLMINDLETGDQPIFNENKSVVLFYNGEIYNYLELKNSLEKKGHKFRTNSDGEVICHLYEEYKEKLFEKLDGMFAIAIWDNYQKELLLARDIPGEKPLYYSRLSDKEIVFASEIKCFKEFTYLKLELDKQAIWDFPTFLWIPEPDTVYENIKALMPGHYLKLNDNGIIINSYPNKFGKDFTYTTQEDLIKSIKDVVTKTVESRLLSDVPVGCFLSGGLDSSIVTTISANYLKNVSTFTIGFEDMEDPYHGRSDESEYAKSYAAKLGTDHHSIKVTAKDFLNNLNLFCKHGDQPFGVSSGLGILSVAEAARNSGVKVLLSGDGADECFGGYSWYKDLLNEEQPAVSNYGDVSYQSFGLPLKNRLQGINAYPSIKKAWAWHYYASENEKENLFNFEMFKYSKSSLRWFEKFKQTDDWYAKDFIQQDRNFYLPNEMLKKVDRMTMAFSIEGRAPFVAPAILNLSDKLTFSDCVKEGKLKWALRKAFENNLPDEIINRPKHGFNVPIDIWLKKEWSFLFENAFSENSRIFKMGIISKQSRDHALKMLYDKEKLNGHTLFCFIMLNMWLENNM